DSRPSSEPATTTQRLIHTLMSIVGFDGLVDGRMAIVSMPPESFIHEDYVQLPPDRTVLVLEPGLQQDQALWPACQRARQAGFTIGIDYSLDAKPPAWLTELADVVRIELSEMRRDQCASAISHLARQGRLFLATGVDGQAEFALASGLGFALVQGYFF